MKVWASVMYTHTPNVLSSVFTNSSFAENQDACMGHSRSMEIKKLKVLLHSSIIIIIIIEGYICRSQAKQPF